MVQLNETIFGRFFKKQKHFCSIFGANLTLLRVLHLALLNKTL